MPNLRPKFKISDNLTTLERVINCAAEFFGTAILVFIGCMSCADGVAHAPHLNISLAFGLGATIAVQCFGHISGSHINPIVTIAAAIVGDLALIEMPVYFVGQMLGAYAAYGVLMSVTPAEHQVLNKFERFANGTIATVRVSGICSPVVNPIITPTQGLFVEFILSLLLVLVCCAVWDHRNAMKHDSVPIKFGLVIGVLALSGGPYTGANMNPARSFAPAAWHGDWANHWVYWIGPILSAVAGAGFYRAVFSKPKSIENHFEPTEAIPLNDRSKS